MHCKVTLILEKGSHPFCASWASDVHFGGNQMPLGCESLNLTIVFLFLELKNSYFCFRLFPQGVEATELLVKEQVIRINMKSLLITLLSLLAVMMGHAENRWTMLPDGSIEWKTDRRLPHHDHIEMSGQRVSTVVRYGVEADGRLHLSLGMVWPMLRTVPNNTHASLMRRVEWNPLDGMLVNGRSVDAATVESIRLKGIMEIRSTYKSNGLQALYQCFPSVDQPAFLIVVTLSNPTKNTLLVELPAERCEGNTLEKKGVKGSYTIVRKIEGVHTLELPQGGQVALTASVQAYSDQKGEKELSLNGIDELQKRKDLVEQWLGNLVLESPEEVVDRMFAFSKIRASESIYQTAGGPMHGPGGESYYAALWCNDQAEYVNPFFPFLGYDYGNASALNCYLHFARYMNDDWKPIPSSIIAEGQDIWNGAGDRGDAAMIAHGAARYVLTRASKDEARQLWPLIKWCLEYCHHKLNAGGVVMSDHDELEGRFPAGEANLCTSTLYYDGLLSAVSLCREMGESSSLSKLYQRRAADLKKSIESYFGADMQGYHTYRYYEGNDLLRSWICMPLVVGINNRAEGTIAALFSDKMWTDNGLLTQEGSTTFWDRSTLYALRGVYAAGYPDKATDFLRFYSNARLLGEHVPYAVEAWPEGNQRHLSAESGLYARIITEGLFGIRPTGFSSFVLTPMLPTAWDKMALRKVRAFGADMDIEVERSGKGLQVTVTNGGWKKSYRVKPGESIQVKLS